jgi:hypothetical protein
MIFLTAGRLLCNSLNYEYNHKKPVSIASFLSFDRKDKQVNWAFCRTVCSAEARGERDGKNGRQDRMQIPGKLLANAGHSRRPAVSWLADDNLRFVVVSLRART